MQVKAPLIEYPKERREWPYYVPLIHGVWFQTYLILRGLDKLDFIWRVVIRMMKDLEMPQAE